MRPTDLRRALAELGITATELAHTLRVDRSTVTRWLNGSRSIPNLAQAAVEALQREKRALDALQRKRS